ncbi:Ig-like domain-containing protein [Cryobacterium sp. Y82]|uniref:Ig-like domain-containing protein n=1 Tax=Cryobacterium sp. Y82 TaxID=2045017 RepID=UPI001E59BB22|nr:Ig-like domain-containing protein [Cryobacterium sp. Y82]
MDRRCRGGRPDRFNAGRRRCCRHYRAGDVAWAVTAGQLPPGITLDPVTGTVAGTRTDSASYSWSITATIVGNMRITKLFSTEDVSVPTVMIAGGATLLTNDRTPTISGTTDAVLVADLGADGVYPVVVTIAVGGVDGPGSQSLTLDTTDAGDGTMVTVLVADQRVATVVAGGTWSVTAAALGEGEHTVTVSITDVAGNIGMATQSYRVAVAPRVTITGGAMRLTNDAAPTISGTTDAANGSVVSVLIDGRTVASIVTDGAFSVPVADLGSDGVYPVVVTITAGGVAGTGSQTITLDTTRPSLAINAGSTLQSLAVTGADFDPGESVQVWIHSTPVLLSTVTANANGAIVTSVIVPAATAAGGPAILLFLAGVLMLILRLRNRNRTIPRHISH